MSIPTETQKTDVGNYFVANYPPFSQWNSESIPAIEAALNGPARESEPLGLYLHIPFCRKRCKFCYYKVYTDKKASQIKEYIDALAREIEIYSRLTALRGRRLRFVYFGGGTPSYLSEKQLKDLVERLEARMSWAHAEEVTFECEPGTLRRRKLETLKEIGVTRLSLGIENFDDAILEWNGRAHLSPEIDRAYGWAREVGFPTINIDLIAGMVGETESNWRDCVEKALRMKPDALTIYQMELPYNTVISREIRDRGIESPIADWTAKRRWVGDAFRAFEANGYRVASAYTVASKDRPSRFVYTDALWHGADMIGLGVSSFGHFDGVHYQNASNFQDYIERVNRGDLPITRALKMTERQRLIREMILQIKTGRIELRYFENKFGVNVWEEFKSAYEKWTDEGMLERRDGSIVLSRKGLLRADGLLPEFFEPEYRNIRYT